MDNHFSQAYKYIETENTSQLENYATEILVVVLCYLKSDENKFSDVNNEIAKLLGFNSSDYKNIKFETQKSHSDFKPKIMEIEKLIPDISIYLNNKLHTIIEVKIDQGLNQYTIDDERKINQLEAYASIDGVQKVILLSKYKEEYETKNDKIKFIRWYEIYEKLEEVHGDFIISHYLQFLDDKDIGKQKPLPQLQINILQYLGSFYSLLHNAWSQANIKEFYLSKNTYAYKWGLGFYIKKTGEKDGSGETDYFLGINQYENVRNKISFWCKKSIGNEDTFEKVYNGFVTENNLDLSKLCKQKADEQIKDLSDWITTNIKPILENKQQEGDN